MSHGTWSAAPVKIVLGEVAATKSANIAFIKNTAQEMKLISWKWQHRCITFANEMCACDYVLCRSGRWVCVLLMKMLMGKVLLNFDNYAIYVAAAFNQISNSKRRDWTDQLHRKFPRTLRCRFVCEGWFKADVHEPADWHVDSLERGPLKLRSST